MAKTHSSILAWGIPWTEQPGGLRYMGCTTDEGSQVAKWKRIHLPGLIPGSERSPGEGHGNPLQYSCLENPMDSGAWWATVCGGHKESGMTEHAHMHITDEKTEAFKDKVLDKVTTVVGARNELQVRHSGCSSPGTNLPSSRLGLEEPTGSFYR